MRKITYISIALGLCASVFSCSKDTFEPVSEGNDDAANPKPAVDANLWGETIPVTVRTDVLNDAYYKDVFMDGGIKLTSRKTLPACDKLGLSLEFFTAAVEVPADSAAQKALFWGSDEDYNGILLFPDGEPRFRLFYSNGGKSLEHGASLEAPGRNAVRKFNHAGGSYLGSCAGAFLAAARRNGNYEPRYYCLWPGNNTSSGLSDSYTGMFVDEGSPLLNYYDFGGDNHVDNVYHNGGCYATDLFPGTETLARYDMPGRAMHGQTSIWAWKGSAYAGRVILCGSHPEGVTEGERLDLMAAMMRYAIDGRGIARIKSELKNGDTYVCDRQTPDGDPTHTRIGDGQCHHYIVAIPRNAGNIRFRLEYAGDYEINLMAKKDSFAFDADADYKSTGTSNVKELEFDSLAGGLWYIGVHNTSRPEVTTGDNGYCKYSGRTELLNGLEYTISVNWD